MRERQKEVKMKLGNFSVREYAILASSSCVEIRGAGGKARHSTLLTVHVRRVLNIFLLYWSSTVGSKGII